MEAIGAIIIAIKTYLLIPNKVGIRILIWIMQTMDGEAQIITMWIPKVGGASTLTSNNSNNLRHGARTITSHKILTATVIISINTLIHQIYKRSQVRIPIITMASILMEILLKMRTIAITPLCKTNNKITPIILHNHKIAILIQ